MFSAVLALFGARVCVCGCFRQVAALDKWLPYTGDSLGSVR